eukprot:6181206-Pleurochrysis_carterae.AAC.3
MRAACRGLTPCCGARRADCGRSSSRAGPGSRRALLFSDQKVETSSASRTTRPSRIRSFRGILKESIGARRSLVNLGQA